MARSEDGVVGDTAGDVVGAGGTRWGRGVRERVQDPWFALNQLLN
jgi:hypothetical protein